MTVPVDRAVLLILFLAWFILVFSGSLFLCWNHDLACSLFISSSSFSLYLAHFLFPICMAFGYLMGVSRGLLELGCHFDGVTCYLLLLVVSGFSSRTSIDFLLAQDAGVFLIFLFTSCTGRLILNTQTCFLFVYSYF